MQRVQFFGSGQLTTALNVGRAKRYLKNPTWSSPRTCLPLSFLLATLHVSVVDYWILDVEGAECSIIKAFNFSHYEVGVLQMERNFAERDLGCMLPLVSAGFTRFRLKQDDIWVNSAYFQRRGLASPVPSAMKLSGEVYLNAKPWRSQACLPHESKPSAAKYANIPLCPENSRRQLGQCSGRSPPPPFLPIAAPLTGTGRLARELVLSASAAGALFLGILAALHGRQR